VTAADVVAETVDYVAITRLQAAYADVVNRRAWPELADLFLTDAPVRVDTVTNPVVDLVGPTGLGTFIGGAIERFVFFEFVVLNARVYFDGRDRDAARARVYMCELRQERETGEFTRAFGVYHDDYRRHDDRWWFAGRRYQSLARSGGEVFAFPEEAW
jgi:SnoaL-like domain